MHENETVGVTRMIKVKDHSWCHSDDISTKAITLFCWYSSNVNQIRLRSGNCAIFFYEACKTFCDINQGTLH